MVSRKPDDDAGHGPPPGSDAGSSGDELLRRWEQRIESAGDPLAALADVLGGRAQKREALFQRSGEVLLGCRLGAILGAGGMGVTYAGVDRAGEPVAVKLVPGAVDGADRRFEQECRLLQSVQHPAVVRYRAHAILPDGTGVLCMDRVAGTDLEQVLRMIREDDPGGPAGALLDGIEGDPAARRQSPRFRRRVLRLLATVADGLHAAHQCGVVHRDVKPANILLRDDLSPVLIDFGLARDHQLRVSFTASGAAMGTLAYMAPEQLGRDAAAVDARTDVYALGLVLYEALCGEPLRPDIAAVLRGASRPFLLDAQKSRMLPIDVQAILYRCLDPRRQRRYRNAAELADDLRAAAGQGDVRARRPSALRRFARDRRRAAAAVAIVAVASLALVAALSPRGREVAFFANCGPEDGRVVLPGGRSIVPGQRVWLPLGPIDVRLVGDGIRSVDHRVEVVAGADVQKDLILTQVLADATPEYIAADRTMVQFTSGHCQRQIAPDLRVDQRFVDEREVESWGPFVPEALLAPGVHEFCAVDAYGRCEVQRVRIGDEPTDVLLLPGVMADVDGAYRRTWSTIRSPQPDDLEIVGDAERWFGRPEPSTVGGAGLNAVPCAFAPREPERDAHVVVRVRFPEPMRTAVVFVRGRVLEGGELAVEACFGDEPPVPWPLDGDGRLVSRLAFVAVEGATEFSLRVRLRAQVTDLPDVALARVLEGSLFGGHWDDEPPCFAIVADHGDAARLPTGPRAVGLAPAAAAAIAIGAVRIPLANAQRVRALAALPGPDGACDLVATVGSPEGHAEVRRLRWPDGALRARFGPGTIRARQSARDGETFGANLASIPDQDGDGWSELAIGDPSSQRGGPGLAGGSVDLVRSRNGAVAWSWPVEAWPSTYGDDEAGTVWSVGDWNGDGQPDVLVNARQAPADGAPQVGRLAVLDAATGAGVASQSGRRAFEALWAVDAVGARADAPAVVLLRSVYSDSTGTSPRGCDWTALVASSPERRVSSPTVARPAAAFLLAEAAGCSVLMLRLGGDSDHFVGLERFTLGEQHFELVARQPVDLSVDALVRDEAALRIGDIDGDGMTDVALLLVREPGPGVWFVSGRDLRPLGWCSLADGPPVPDYAMLWMPAVGDVPAQLVVATRATTGGEANLELRGIVPR